MHNVYQEAMSLEAITVYVKTLPINYNDNMIVSKPMIRR
jgi:hypothetical protein